MGQHSPTPYKAADFSNLKGLQGISDQAVEIHLGLYQGYVTNTNKLNEQIAELLKAGKAASPEFAELNRALGFEYNGMILHEYYFGNLTPKGNGEPKSGSGILKAIEGTFGSWQNWLADFKGIGTMRGVGWAVMYLDPATDRVSNHWITLHQTGHPAGFKPLLVMDVWEHAFMVDYKPSERAKYIDAFFSNIDWQAVDKRLKADQSIRPVGENSRVA